MLAASGLVACEASEPACSEVSMHVGRLLGPPDAYSTEVEGAFLSHCLGEKWSAEVRRCLLATTTVEQPKNCRAKLTPEQAAALDQDLAAAERRESARVLPQACLDLEVHVARAMACEAIPKAERERIQQQFTLTKASWDKVVDKQMLSPTCGSAITALKQATVECTQK